MHFNCKKIKQLPLSYLINLTLATRLLIVLALNYVASSTYPSAIENSKSYDRGSPSEVASNQNTQNKTIIVVNGQPTQNYLLTSLKKDGFLVVNLITSTSKINREEITRAEAHYDSVIIQTTLPETLEALKLLFQTKGYSFSDVLANKQSDVALGDAIRESFNKPFNGEIFRNFSRDKISAIHQLNKTLQAQVGSQVITVEEFTKAVLKQNLPCSVKVMDAQQILATYFIGKPSDVAAIFEKLKTYKASNVKLWLQPYHKNLYRLQITSFNGKAIPVALWHEKTCIKEGGVQPNMRALVNLKESPIISQDKLVQLSQQLAEAIHLKQGVSEFILLFHENKIEVVDYNLFLSNHNEIEVMERVIGYSPLSYHFMHSALLLEIPLAKKEFKNIVAVNLFLKSKNDLLKLSMMPTFYRYYSDKEEVEEEVPLSGELYLVHTDSTLIVASYAGIKNREQALLNPMFSSHCATHIVNFYREAATNAQTNYTPPKDETSQVAETKEALERLHHESQHIPKYVKPLDNKAGIQDIMRYYIDIYDLYILHGKPPGTKVLAMNTGNPAFLPFPPIVEMLRKSFEEDKVEAYARYSMQVPGADFVNKISHYCHEERILAPHQKLQSNNVVIGHGSTNLYYLALKSIIKNKGDIVLITRPTYGLFIDPVYTAGGEIGFIDLKESDGWKVHPERLHETIHFYNEKAFNEYILNTFLKEYEKLLQALHLFNLDRKSVPPIPNIEEITELTVFDEYIEKLNTYVGNISDSMVNKDELKFSFPPRVRAFYHMNPHNPTGAVYTKEDLKQIAEVTQGHGDIYIIDDLAHWGVLYEEIEPATFASLDGMFEKTLTLMSLSKSYCTPALRTGVAIGNAKIISEMQYRLLNSSSSASYPAMIALDAVFSSSKQERDNYLNRNSQEYLFRRNLMGVLINGIQQTKLPHDQKIKIYQVILESEYKHGKPLDNRLLNLILSGIPLVRTLTEPKGCFFHLLDISKLIGAKIGNNAPLQTSTDVRNAIYSICNIDTVPGEISGNFFSYSLRMSFSLTSQQIYSACKSINLFIGNYIIKYNPSILEKNNSSFKSRKVEALDEVILSKALMRFYLSQAIQSITVEHTRIVALNAEQNNSKLQELEKKITELKMLIEKILDQSLGKTIHKEIQNYIEKNQRWLKGYIPDFEQMKKLSWKS